MTAAPNGAGARRTGRAAAALIAAAVAVLAADAVRPGLFSAHVRRVLPDFGAYYSAAGVHRAGGDPYHLPTLAAAQAAAFPGQDPLPARGTPWSLAVIAPLTAADYGAARTAWLLLSVGLLAGSGGLLWAVYGGADRLAWVGPVLAVSGYAGIQLIGLGQLSVLTVAGLAGFVWADRAGRPVAAGFCLTGLLFKPQNHLVLAVVLGLWAVGGRRWRVLAGAAAGTALLTAAVVWPNPDVFAEYVRSLAADPPAKAFRPPLPGTMVRLLFGWDRFWLTFVPLFPGVAWGVWYYLRHRRTWNWADRLPLVLLIGYLASPYGWAYDQIVFLFPVLQVAAALSRRPGPGPLLVVAASAVMVVYYRVMLNWGFDEFHWVWVAPAVLAAYLAVRSPAPAAGAAIPLGSC